MAAEKLTKARLVQILIIFAILLTAFTWRTFQHQNTPDPIVCLLGEPCTIKVDKMNLLVQFSQYSNKEIRISIQDTENKNNIIGETINFNSEIIEEKVFNSSQQQWVIKVNSEQNASFWSLSIKGGKTYWLSLKKECNNFTRHLFQNVNTTTKTI